MQYLNFELSLDAAGQLRAQSVMGQVPAVGQPAPAFTLDPNDPTLAPRLQALALGRAEREDLQAVGRALAAAVLPGDVGVLFDQTRGAAAGQPGTGVRLRLRVDSPSLAALPWELLWRPGDRDPLGISTSTVVTRFLDLNVPMRSLAAPRTLRLLAIVPKAEGINVTEHKAGLEAAAKAAQGAIELVWLDGHVTRERIRSALSAAETHLVHYIGHGTYEDGQPRLLLNDDYGDAFPVSAATFAGFFRDRASVRLVVLNACQGAAHSSAGALVSAAPLIVQQGVPAVIAMQWDIYDWAAQKFSAVFYGTLCAGTEAGEVDTAATRARAALHDDAPDSRAFATPALLLRAESGRLWEMSEEQEKDREEREKGTAGGGQTQSGRSNIQFGPGATVHGDVIGGDKTVNTTYSPRTINTGGGAYYEGDINTAGGDFYGGGRQGLSAAEVAELFKPLYARVEAAPNLSPAEKGDVKADLQEVQAEAAKGDQADESFLARRLRNIGRMAPDVLEVALATLTSPAAGFAAVVRKVAERIKQEAK